MERPWLEHYDDGVPETLAPYPEQTLVDIVKATAAERPRHTAAIFKGARLSYGELDGASDGFAAWLAARGVVKGDRVALIMPNCPQVIIAQLGVWKAGAVAVPLNPLSSEEELAHALAGTGARAARGASRRRLYCDITACSWRPCRATAGSGRSSGNGTTASRSCSRRFMSPETWAFSARRWWGGTPGCSSPIPGT